MKLFTFEIKRTPRTPKDRFVSDVSAVVEPQFQQLWEALGKVREDLNTTHRLAQKCERAVYRHAGNNGETKGDEVIIGPQQKFYRTGDTLP